MLFMIGTGVSAQQDTVNSVVPDSAIQMKGSTVGEVTVVTRRPGTSRLGGAVNGVKIGQEELFKAACCNLGESFSTNPSVDVNYSDVTTGARQIKLLGLSGTYVQMLTENLPNYRGAAAPYSLGYVPGPWMKSIQVSKGCSSVKNGYEAITGQINVDFKKPEDEEGAEINVFGDTKTRFEANADGNIHINKSLSTELLAHFENSFENHDENNDGFYDKPKVRQINVNNRWFGRTRNYIFHGGMGALTEKREGGQTHAADMQTAPLYNIRMNTDRYEAYMKHAFILDHSHGTNIALMASGTMHAMDAAYGNKWYDINEKNVYASLIFETNPTKAHNISAGLSFNHDYLKNTLYMYNIETGGLSFMRLREKENVPGMYAQYTYNLHHRFTAMAGIRLDHSNVYGTFVTPRFHLKYAPADIVSIRLSAGKGYRTPHILAENNYLLASGRKLVAEPLRQEEAWNYGASTALNIPLFGETLKLNMEYYYTRFKEQAVIDYDSDPFEIRIYNLDGKSYSHTFQIDATYELFRGMTLTAAYRLSDVKTTIGGRLMEKPLTSKYKGLLTASYKTPLGLWQFDATLQLNGGGRMPAPYEKEDGTPSWNTRFGAYEQLSAQITRWFRHFSVYVGGENLTGFKQKTPIISADNPWSREFEPTMIWGPVHGAMVYAGIRVKIGRD
ncbi:TonB-dependent receptor [Prevotella sp. PCHR]|uniref:TonB-dependent receptor n=2 Tax=Xylanibacter caecicola TaxID=2736294 RepID=A0ABX2B0B6_9BACT|nr:TonB-dependent receptor [Xylanibacter caecicola]